MKLPFFQFYPSDWLRDTRRISPQARATWIDILSYAWNEPTRGVYKRSKQAMGFEHGLDLVTLGSVLKELEQVADVTIEGDIVTVTSRRMERAERLREKGAVRQLRFRDKRKSNATRNASVTPQTSDVRRQTLDVINVKDNNNTMPPGPPKGAFDLIWNSYPSRTGRKAAQRHFSLSVRTAEDWANIQKALANYKTSDRVANGYIQNGSTWFNNWRDWVDYVPPTVGAAAPAFSYAELARKKREEKEHGTNGSASIPDASNFRVTEKRSSGFRKGASTVKSLLAGIGNLPPTAPEAEAGAGKRIGSDEDFASGVREESAMEAGAD